MLANAPLRFSVLVAAVLLVGLAQARADETGRPGRQQAWAERITAFLKLTAPQQSALQAFVTVTSVPTKAGEASHDQLRAMSLIERTDYYARQTAAYHDSDQAAATALHRFYDTLTPAQRQAFDKDTAGQARPATVAADTVSLGHPETPDFRAPAHTNADWLIKPTAENIARVYPSEAMRQHLSGKVTLSCIADEDGYLADCLVDSETPGGRGFGNAALEITAYMRMQPATNYGVPVKAPVRLPITFAFPDPD